MGWTFSYSATEKKQIIEDCTRDCSSAKCIKKSLNSNELWTIWEDNTGNKIIVLFLLACRDKHWGYKDMTESMHPYYYKCPMSFLEEVPVVCQPWRDSVKAYHERSKNSKKISKTISVGQIVKLSNSVPSEFKVKSISPFLGVSLENGMTYKLIKSRIVEVL